MHFENLRISKYEMVVTVTHSSLKSYLHGIIKRYDLVVLSIHESLELSSKRFDELRRFLNIGITNLSDRCGNSNLYCSYVSFLPCVSPVEPFVAPQVQPDLPWPGATLQQVPPGLQHTQPVTVEII